MARPFHSAGAWPCAGCLIDRVKSSPYRKIFAGASITSVPTQGLRKARQRGDAYGASPHQNTPERTRTPEQNGCPPSLRAISGGVAGPFWPPQLLPGHLPSFGGEIRRRRRRPRHFGLRTCHEECVRSRGCRRVARGASTITSLGGVAEAQPQPRGSLSAFGRVFGQKRPHGKAALQSGFARARALAWLQCWAAGSHKRHQGAR